jgi:glutamate--cysteine ligase catalytic subunit
MGFLTIAEPIEWEESLAHTQFVRGQGIEQFIHLFLAAKGIESRFLRFGDEVEYMVLTLEGDAADPDRKTRVSLRAAQILNDVKELEAHGLRHGLSASDMSSWMPEYGSYMVEGCPFKPFEGIQDLAQVEEKMRARRSRVMAVLRPDEVLSTLTTFPLLGVGDFCNPPHPPKGSIANSIFVPDELITPHPRFHTLTRNIRSRKGRKVEIRRPIYQDVKTHKSAFAPESRVDPFSDQADSMPDAASEAGSTAFSTATKRSSKGASSRLGNGLANGEMSPKRAGPNADVPKTEADADRLPYVYADAMIYGMGCCCLQVTFQAENVVQSRHLYDHLAVLTPLMLALTAGSPIMRGFLLNEDCRWNSVAQSVDDRTDAERGLESLDEGDDGDSRLAGGGVRYMRKSRYGSISSYLCNCKGGRSGKHYSDIEVAYDQKTFNRLKEAGCDEMLSRHVAHLFARDPLVIFKNRIKLDNRVDVDHWENLQSTNWQSVRWKPPPPKASQKEATSEEHIGWRVEFRSMEVQITDFENAAFVSFIVLISRVIAAFELNLYIPISKLDQNMDIAHRMDACLKEKFWFRSSVVPEDLCNEEHTMEQFTLKEILLGTGKEVGLLALCHLYLDFIGCDGSTRSTLETYLKFIAMRTTGAVKTPARWIRDFVLNHPTYEQDSRVTRACAYDLVRKTSRIATGEEQAPDLLGPNVIKPLRPASHIGTDSGCGGPGACSEEHCDSDGKVERAAFLLAEFRSRSRDKYENQLEVEVRKLQDELEKQKLAMEKARSELDDFRRLSSSVAESAIHLRIGEVGSPDRGNASTTSLDSPPSTKNANGRVH